ncbi:MAG: HTH domain-containing protein, partial [Bacteroidota bacterium]
NVGVNVGVNDGEEKNVGVNVGVNDGEEKNVGVNVGVNDGEEKNVGINVGVSDGEEKNVGVNVGVNDGEEDNFEKREEKLPETLLSQLVDVFADQAIAESGADRASRNVREKLVQIVAILSRQEGRNSDDLNQEFQKSTRTIERYLKLLKDYGAIEFQGPPKSGGYYLTAEFKAGLPRE